MKTREVSKEEFFKVMGPCNVHPRSECDRSVWIDQTTHQVVGVTTPGYLGEGKKTYQLVKED